MSLLEYSFLCDILKKKQNKLCHDIQKIQKEFFYCHCNNKEFVKEGIQQLFVDINSVLKDFLNGISVHFSDHFETLPDELICLIFSHLPCKDLFNAFQVNKRFESHSKCLSMEKRLKQYCMNWFKNKLKIFEKMFPEKSLEYWLPETKDWKWLCRHIVDRKKSNSTWKKTNNSLTIGETHNDQPSIAVQVFCKGTKYDGEWVAGKKEGFGRLYLSCGDIFFGKWQDNLKHGEGMYQFCDGEIHIGFWLDGKRHGRNTTFWLNGESLETDWLHGQRNRNSENVIYTYPNGDMYSGGFVYGTKFGFGIYYYNDGRKYEGNWENGEKHGWGIFTNSDGSFFKGTWNNGIIQNKKKTQFLKKKKYL